MEKISCIICGSDKYTIFRKVKSSINEYFTLVKCDCEFIYLNPRPSSVNIQKYYDSEKYHPHMLMKNLRYIISRRILFYWKYFKIKKIFYKNGTLLDYGSGDGSFSEFMKSKGWTVYSFDSYNKFNSNDNLSNIKDKSVDIITMWHSIEHIHEIKENLQLIKRKMKNESYLIIACPNINSVDQNLFPDSWIAYDIPRHLYHFTPQTMNLLLNKFGFKIIKRYKMPQDTLFNIYLSLNKYYLIIKIPIFIILILYSFFIQNIKKDKSSSYMYVCK